MTTQPISVSDNAIPFGDRLAASTAFKALFAEGMNLVEETAAYLDGPGRDDARQLPRAAALAYAAESMRLTTRLMQIASWLLLQRAVNEGEMTPAEASADKRRSRAAWQFVPTVDPATPSLPAPLLALIDMSMRLQKRILRLDDMINEPKNRRPEEEVKPLHAQMERLRQAFPGSP